MVPENSAPAAEPTADLPRMARQVLLAAFSGAAVPDWLAAETDAGLTGICLYGNNFAPGDGQLANLARAIRLAAPELLLALDEEGGDVTRLHAATGSPSPGNAALGRFDQVAATAAVAAGIGIELRAAGVRLNLGPIADINSNSSNPVIGTRSFGSDPAVVADHTAGYVTGLQGHGVAACVKHFPGHGDTAVDSHLDLPTVEVSGELLRARELVPFVAAIGAGAAAVMTSHLVVTSIDPDRPATVSPAVLQGLLRQELGFTGVIVTDALDMAGVAAGRGVPEAAVQSLIAGADLLCLGPAHEAGRAQITAVVDAIVVAATAGRLPVARLQDAAARATALRLAWNEPPEPISGTDELTLIEAAQVAATVAAALVDGHPPADLDRPDTLVITLETGSNMAVGHTVWGNLHLGRASRRTLRPADCVGPASIDAVADHPGGLILVGRRWSADEQVWGWLVGLRARRPDAVVVELGWPTPQVRDLPGVLLGWGAADVIGRAVGDRLSGRGRR